MFFCTFFSKNKQKCYENEQTGSHNDFKLRKKHVFSLIFAELLRFKWVPNRDTRQSTE